MCLHLFFSIWTEKWEKMPLCQENKFPNKKQFSWMIAWWQWTMSDMVKYRAAIWSFLKLTALYFTMSDIVHHKCDSYFEATYWLLMYTLRAILIFFFINANSLFFMTRWNSDFGLTKFPKIGLNHGYGIICKTKLLKGMVKFVDQTFKYHLTSKYVSKDRNKMIRRI